MNTEQEMLDRLIEIQENIISSIKEDKNYSYESVRYYEGKRDAYRIAKSFFGGK